MPSKLELVTQLNNEQTQHVKEFVNKISVARQIIFKLDANFLDGNNLHVQHLLLIKEHRLIGYALLSCYDLTEMEVTFVVGDDVAGFLELYQKVITVGMEKGVAQILFIAEQKDLFLINQLQKQQTSYAFSEYRMNYNFQEIPKIESTVTLKVAKEENRQQILWLSNSDELENAYSVDELAAVEVEGTQLAYSDSEMIGKLRLDETAEMIGIYGFIVAPQWRGKGFGRQILQKLLAEMSRDEKRVLYLEVESQNEVALRLYQSLGFEEVAKFDYFEQKLNLKS